MVKRNKNYKNVYSNRAKVFFHLNDFKSCLLDIESGIAATSKNESLRKLYCLKGDVSVQLEDLDGAIVNYNKAIELDPTYFLAYIHRGQCFLKREKHQEAINDFTESLQ